MGHNEQEQLAAIAAPLPQSEQREPPPSTPHKHAPLFSAMFSGFALLVSGAALYMTIHQAGATNAVAVASMFSNLRSHYHEVDSKLPLDYMDPNVRYQPGRDRWQSVRRYWDQAFDEWFVSTKLHDGGVEDLWKDFYADAVGLSLRSPAMRAVYCDLDYGGKGQTTARRQFNAAITAEFASIRPGKPLCPVPMPSKDVAS